MLLVRWQEGHPACKKTEWWDAGMVMWLGQGTHLHMDQLMPLPLTVSCSAKCRLVLPFWYRLTLVVPDRIREGHKTVVCMCVCVPAYPGFPWKRLLNRCGSSLSSLDRVPLAICGSSGYQSCGDGCVWHARLDFLLVFYSDLRSSWNCRRVISRWT